MARLYGTVYAVPLCSGSLRGAPVTLCDAVAAYSVKGLSAALGASMFPRRSSTDAYEPMDAVAEADWVEAAPALPL